MILNIGEHSFNIIFNREEINNKTPVLFLHGFTGSSKDWNFLINELPKQFTPVLIDLLGHGKTSSPKLVQEYTEESQVEQIKHIIAKLSIQKLILVGYSMGGRLALAFSVKYPDLVKAIVLESTSFGIASKIEKQERIKQDYGLVKRIEKSSLEDFFNFWFSIPLFDSLRKIQGENLEIIKQSRIKSNNKTGMQNSLLGFGTGKMKYHLDNFKKLNFKVLLITGELDEKFSAINKIANEEILNSKFHLIKNCGHNVHLEKTEEFLKLLNSFLLNVQEDK